MELGSIHPDEQSARRAVATLIRAGIEPERVKLIGPRVRPHGEPAVEPPRAWRARAEGVTGGVMLGAAVGALACVLLTVLGAPLLEPGPLTAYVWVVGTAMVAGLAAALVIQWRYLDLIALAHPQRRTARARGWAVIVHARDVEQRALAARALRALSSTAAA